jgi:type IV secretion system protein VirB4
MSSERSREFLDNILQSKTQFLLSEFITFVSAKKALARIEQYKKTLTSVKSVKMAGDLYINDALDLNTGSANDFCASQISIILYADDHNILQKRIENFSKILNEVGLKVVREDFNMQIAFFNALPGNTFYSNRASYLPTLFAAPFSDIHSKQNGSYNGSKWGDPVTILKTTKDHHYNFNFHYKDNGNTIIIGPKGTGKTTLTHFLLAQSLKFDVKIIYIDLEGRCSNFIKAINGKIIKLSQDTISPVQIDILNIDNYAGKSKWMAELLLKICEGDGSYMCNNKSYIEKFQDLTKKLIAIEGNEEKIKYLDSFINGFSDLTIKTNYKNFFKASFFNKFFGKDIVEDFTQNKYLGIDLSSISNVRSLFRPFLGLLLAKTQSFLMGQKTIIVINHDHNIFDAYTFQNQVEEWLENLTRNNAILLLAQQNDTIKAVYEKFAKILPYFASTICLSNKIMDKEIKYIFNLSNQEAHYISGNDKEKRKFLLKHGEDSVFTKVNLSNLKEVLKYLD